VSKISDGTRFAFCLKTDVVYAAVAVCYCFSGAVMTCDSANS
jgi:hypothetical protein